MTGARVRAAAQVLGQNGTGPPASVCASYCRPVPLRARSYDSSLLLGARASLR